MTDNERITTRKQAEKDLFIGLFSFGGCECYEIIDDGGIRKPAVRVHHQETLDERPDGNKERYVIDIDWRLFNKWFGKGV